MPESLGFNKIGQFDWQPILAGDFQRVPQAVTLAAGQEYKVGSVLGRVEATGICKLVDSSQSDGSEKPYAVLAEDIDATDEARPGIAWLTGEFIRHRLIFGGTDTWQTHEIAARGLSIFFRDAAQQPNQ